MDQAVHPHQALADRLVSALRQDEFILYGQLIAPLAPGEGDRPFREILVRFQEEESKLLPPGSFFPVLEESGLMPYLDRWVVNRTARWIRSVRAIGPERPLPRASINLSTATLGDRKFAEFTRKHIQAATLPEGALSFEICCDIDSQHVHALLDLAARLRLAGCGFILARYDGGRDAIELRRRLAPEFVKLSPGAVRLLGQGEVGVDKVHAINRECHALGIKTIAEHVESNQTMMQLREIGVDFAQGFGVEAPLPLT